MNTVESAGGLEAMCSADGLRAEAEIYKGGCEWSSSSHRPKLNNGGKKVDQLMLNDLQSHNMDTSQSAYCLNVQHTNTAVS